MPQHHVRFSRNQRPPLDGKRGDEISGERTRPACWWSLSSSEAKERLAETNFPRSAEHEVSWKNQICDGEVAIVSTRVACAPRKFIRAMIRQ